MTEFLSLNEEYTTTRKLVKAPPEFSGKLLYPDSVNQGGLRTQGIFKGIEKDKPLITIITVVYNGAKFLEDTIKSVVNQTYNNVEYIIVDGGSSDSTLDIIKMYEHCIDYWISDKDEGIYHAMNKGIELATGEWICFMNGGDGFYQESVLAEVFSQPDSLDVQVIVGRHQVVYPNGRTRLVSPGPIKDLWKGSQFCHQATFVKTDYHKLHKFNVHTKIVADFEFFHHAWQNNVKFKYVNVIVAKFEAGGVSDVKRIEAILGFWLIANKSLIKDLFFICLIIIERLKQAIKNVFK